jgi:hypothetical protein
VLRLDHHADAARTQVQVEPRRDLLGQALLDLRAVGEMLHHPGQLGQSEDAVAGQVADVRDADERQQVVLAHRPDRDVPGENQFVVPLVIGERGQVERARGEQFGVRVDHPAGRVPDAVVRQVQAERLEQVGGGSFGRDEVAPRCGPEYSLWRQRHVGPFVGRRLALV